MGIAEDFIEVGAELGVEAVAAEALYVAAVVAATVAAVALCEAGVGALAAAAAAVGVSAAENDFDASPMAGSIFGMNYLFCV